MVNLDTARIVKYETQGHEFELLVDPDLAQKLKDGEKKFDEIFNNLFAVEEIYIDAKKGKKASDKAIKDVFKTNDFKIVSKEIILKGKLNLTTEQKRKILQNKKLELINYIVRNSINPITKAPHTPQSVTNALEKIRFELDLNKSIDKQIDKIVEKLQPILPMTFQQSKITIFVPVGLAGKINKYINRYNVLNRKWSSNEFVCTIIVSIGLKDEFINTISGLTEGKTRFEIE